MDIIYYHTSYIHTSVLYLSHKISDKAIQIAAYWEAKGIWRPIRQEKEEFYTDCSY